MEKVLITLTESDFDFMQNPDDVIDLLLTHVNIALEQSNVDIRFDMKIEIE